MRLWVYAVRRVALLVPLLIGVVTVLFAVFSALPAMDRTAPYSGVLPTSPAPSGNPSCPRASSCGPSLDPNAVAFLQLNQPVPVQWAVYVYHSLTFQWGHVAETSTLGDGNSGLPALKGQAVTSVLAAFLPYSLELILLAVLFTVVVVLPIQTRAMVHRGQGSDRAARLLSLAGFGIPGFLVGILVLTLAGWLITSVTPSGAGPICPSGTAFLEFYGSWPVPNCWIWGTSLGQSGLPGWLVNGYQSTPTGFPTADALLHGNGWLALDTLLRIALPALVIAFGATAAAFRFARYTPIERTDPEFLRTARAQGLPESKVVQRHAGRYALIVLVSALGPSLLAILGSLPIIESIFGLDGVGRLFAFSLVTVGGTYDFGILFGVVLLCAFLILGAGVVLDLLRGYLDPGYLAK